MIALIVGISGQDGAYLAKLLLAKGYSVWGSSRFKELNNFTGLKYLGIYERVKLISLDPTDFGAVKKAIQIIKPDEIYNLGGQTSVGLSFEDPPATLTSIITSTHAILEAIRLSNLRIRFYNAGSGEMYGEQGSQPTKLNATIAPKSPYGVAKASAFLLVKNYRESYKLFCCTGVLFNHESILRPERFVTRKMILSALRIKAGSHEKLQLGNVKICRDWGLAQEYVEAMWRLLNISEPRDIIVATGVKLSLNEFGRSMFEGLQLNWAEHTEIRPEFLRPTEIMNSWGDPEQAEKYLNWSAKTKGRAVGEALVNEELHASKVALTSSVRSHTI